MATVSFETRPCTRCGGSGHFSYNSVDGTRCFGCRGKGTQLTKRGAEAKRYAEELLRITVEEYIDSPEPCFCPTSSGKRFEVGCIEFKKAGEDTPRRLNPETGEWVGLPVFNILNKDGQSIVATTTAKTTLQRPVTAEIVEKVRAYQDTLTDQGKVSKRAKG